MYQEYLRCTLKNIMCDIFQYSQLDFIFTATTMCLLEICDMVTVLNNMGLGMRLVKTHEYQN